MFVNARALIERNIDDRPELLFQVRDKPGEREALELPGGRVEEYEGLLDALSREVREETGLEVVEVVDAERRTSWTAVNSTVECVVPSFVYQTTRGPIDSVGFFFRCRVTGDLATKSPEAYGHLWIALSEAAEMLRTDPDRFDWLTQAALAHYLESVHSLSS